MKGQNRRGTLVSPVAPRQSSTVTGGVRPIPAIQQPLKRPSPGVLPLHSL